MNERRSTANRRAVTLLEVLLVLGLLVVMAAIAWPALERPLASQRLKSAADRIRSEWGRARVEAMSSGKTLLFRYAVEGEQFTLQRRAGLEYASETDEMDGANSADTLSAREQELFTSNDPQNRLPEGITFAEGETAEDTRSVRLVSGTSYSDARGASPAGNDPADSELGWSDPILFYPDGTTSNARLRLASEHGQTIELSLRGLTGAVTVSKPGISEE